MRHGQFRRADLGGRQVFRCGQHFVCKSQSQQHQRIFLRRDRAKMLPLGCNRDLVSLLADLARQRIYFFAAFRRG